MFFRLKGPNTCFNHVLRVMRYDLLPIAKDMHSSFESLVVIHAPSLHASLMDIVATLALGSRPRQGVARLRAKRETRESLHMLLGVQRV
jgi:hypothetical protein